MNSQTTNISRPLQIKSVIIFVILILSSAQLFAQEARLLFKSNFDGINVVTGVYHRLTGTDTKTGYTWPDDFPGNSSKNWFNYIVSDPANNYLPFVDAKIDTVIGPDGTSAKALYMDFKKDDPDKVSKSRAQYTATPDRGNSDKSESFKKLYIKYNAKLHLGRGASGYLQTFEYKACPSTTSFTEIYRISLYIYGLHNEDETPYWYLKAQYSPGGVLGDNDWTYSNHKIPVPEDKWFTFEIYYNLDADPSKGFYKVAINGQILFDHQGRTITEKVPNPEVSTFNPFKVYGQGFSSQLITNVEIWDQAPENSVLGAGVPENSVLGAGVPEDNDTPISKDGLFTISPGLLIKN